MRPYDRIARKKQPWLHKRSFPGEKWKRDSPGKTAFSVRGTNRQVIVVRSPDPRMFEEAIFVLKEDYVRTRSADQVLEEARRAANDYLRRHGAPERRSPFRPILAAVIGGLMLLAAGTVWLVLYLGLPA